MKILFLNEYCYPFTPGGAEESMMHLAEALVVAGHTVRISTPNYGASLQEIYHGVEIVRYPFPKKSGRERKTIRAWWHTSLFWWVYSTWQTVCAVRDFHPDVIHVHGKFHVPAGVIAGKVFSTPVMFTARDYRALCNYGRCINALHPPRRCTLREYWRFEFPNYVHEYTSGDLRAWVVNFLYALRGRVWSSWLYFFVRRVDLLIGVSQAVAQIFRENRVFSVDAIYNIQAPLPVAEREEWQKRAVFVGKISPGKGGALLAPMIQHSIENDPEFRWTIFTNGGILFDRLRADLSYLVNQGFVEIRPYVPHDELLSYMAESAVVVIPSVWHEPLTRLALEALQSGTPVVLTDRGGSREVIQNGVTGRLTAVDAHALAEAVLEVVRDNAQYRERVAAAREFITNTFFVQPLQQYQQAYAALVEKVRPHKTLGVILPPGGSLRVLDAHGQKSRFISYLEHYRKTFERVLVFSFERELGAGLPDGVTIVTPPRDMRKRWYTLLMPILQRRFIRRCQVLRVMQMDGCIPAVIARVWYRIPFVVTFGYKYVDFALLRHRTWFARFMRAVEWIGMRMADKVIYTTEELRQYLFRRFGKSVARKLAYIPNGVDTEQFAPYVARESGLVLFVGRLEKQKNLFALLEAVASLPEHSKIRCVFIGRGSLQSPLLERARELGVQLEIIERIDHAELPAWYARASVFSLVSHIEGMPKVLVEAMSAGCACLVSDCDGNRVLIEDGRNGLVVQPHAEQIAGGLERLLRDPILCEKLGKSAREDACARYDLTRLLKEECELLASIQHG